MATTHYDAFISYSHSADGKLAPAVQSGLQRLGRSWRSVRALKVFRDETGLSVNPHLWSSIQEALEHSRYFVLMASPDAARSEWVNREIETWLSEMPGERILPVLTDGDLVWDEARNDFDHGASTGVPPALFGRLTEEPRYLDLRWAHRESQLNLRNGRFRDAVADLAAPMHGISKDELQSEDLRQYRRRMRVAWAAGATVALLAVVAVIGALAALAAQSHANDLASAAQVRQLAAESTAARAAQPDLARLLAVEAFRRSDDATTRAALQAADVAPLPPARVIAPAGGGGSAAGGYTDAAVSGDGRVVAGVERPADANGGPTTVELRDARTGRRLGSVRVPASTQVALDRRGDRVAVSAGGAVQIVDVASSRVLHSVPSGFAPSGLALDADGSRVAVGEFDGDAGNVTVYDVATGAPLGSTIRTGFTNSLAIAPDGSKVAVVTGATTAVLSEAVSPAFTGAPPAAQTVTNGSTAVTLWDVASGAAIPIPPSVPSNGVTSVAFSPDGLRLAVASSASGTSVVDLAPGGRDTTVTPTVPGVRAGFADDGTLLTLWSDGTFTRFDPATATERGVPVSLGSTGSQVRAMGWLGSTGPVTVSNVVTVWRASGADRLSEPVLGVSGSALEAASGDGRRIVVQLHPNAQTDMTTSDATVAQAYDTKTGRRIGTPTKPGLSVVALADGGRTLVTNEAGLGLYRLPGMTRVGRPVTPDPLTPGYVSGATASRGGRTLVYVTTLFGLSESTASVGVVDARGGQAGDRPVSLGNADPTGFVVALAPDAQHALVMSPSGSAAQPRLLDLRHHRVVPLPRAAPAGAAAAAYSPDGRTIAFAVPNGVVFVDAGTFEPVGVPWQEPGLVPTAVVFSPDGKELAVAANADQQQTTRVVDVASRTTVGVPFPAGINSRPAFAGDGLLVTTGPGGVLRWTLDPRVWAEVACATAGRNLTRAEWNRYLPSGATYHATCPAFPPGR
jgi:WD40 repeat protein